jgi:hypothetical protein
MDQANAVTSIKLDVSLSPQERNASFVFAAEVSETCNPRDCIMSLREPSIFSPDKIDSIAVTKIESSPHSQDFPGACAIC